MSGTIVLLQSYPRSGNTLVRQVIESILLDVFWDNHREGMEVAGYESSPVCV